MDAFIGEIRLLPYTFAPDSWAYCQGQQTTINQNQALYAVIGNKYGGTAPNFNLPDLRGRTVIGAGTGINPNGSSLTPRTLAQQVGEASVALTSNQMPAHTHTLNAAFNNDPAVTLTAAPVANQSWFTYLQTSEDSSNTFTSNAQTANTTLSPTTIGASGGGNNGQAVAHENRQPFLVFNYFICLYGVFPSPP